LAEDGEDREPQTVGNGRTGGGIDGHPSEGGRPPTAPTGTAAAVDSLHTAKERKALMS
jgi:hypothetical protein